ncbi:MAG: peptide chain release factor 3 [Candidatus Sumerlaeia bacterium]|nr:peptide chain release factor 3 [Candidatus Sumerlaeia bacterium]
MTTLDPQIQRRRTFAIISHPDAGKTTLTEKLLLYGGAIHLAGEVKSRRSDRSARSDFMSIEKQRGISVSTAVMQFPYHQFQFNLLDTPGHQDFSEDTYRTICAADCAVMLVDAAKGVEPQTEKLFQVCRLREMPIFTFINKMDREGRDPLELMEEIEKLLGIHCVPANWPIGRGRDFGGVFDRFSREAILFERSEKRGLGAEDLRVAIEDPRVEEAVGIVSHREFLESLELVEGAGEEFDEKRFLAGDITPVFFGSALTTFGVEPFMERFGELAPMPSPRHTTSGIRGPEEAEFSAFIFKIQANMDKNHRDRIAFARLVSGQFKPGMEVLHVREGRKMRINNATTFFANEREAVEEAWAGDIIGLYDTGTFRIGDTLTQKSSFVFEGIPRFCPEKFARVRTPNPLKRKHLDKGLLQLSQEGTVQVLRNPELGDQEQVLAVVGHLQFEVAAHRLNEEYNVEVQLDPLPFAAARWVVGSPTEVKMLNRSGISAVLEDSLGRPIVLFRDDWTMKHAIRNYDKLQFLAAAPDTAPEKD